MLFVDEIWHICVAHFSNYACMLNKMLMWRSKLNTYTLASSYNWHALLIFPSQAAKACSCPGALDRIYSACGREKFIDTCKSMIDEGCMLRNFELL